MKTKHKSGPWRVELDRTGKAMSIRCEPDEYDGGSTICDMISSRGIQETTANARLMAAAPELYEALSLCRSILFWNLSSLGEDEINASYRREAKALKAARIAMKKAMK